MTESLDSTIRRLIQRIELSQELATRIVAVYRAEVPDYSKLSAAVIENDVLPNSLSLVEHLLTSITTLSDVDPEFDEQLRDSAVRRFHQGVSIEGLLQSYRLWGRLVWNEIKAVIRPEDPVEVASGLEVAERIMTYVDHTSVVVAQAFFAEVSGVRADRSIVRGDLLDALLGDAPASAEVERRLAAMSKELSGSYVVLVLHTEDRFNSGSYSLRSAVDHVREKLRPDKERLLIGARGQELVVVYPTTATEREGEIEERCEAVAVGLHQYVVGVGRRHEGVQGIEMSYGEAAEAAAIAVSLERFGRVTHFREVLLDHLARASRFSHSLIEDTLVPLRKYDDERNTTLVQTLRTFYETRYSLTRSANLLHVHPNTVTYRLRRVHELTGLDPADPDDLLLLSMGLKLGELDR
ncbi:hypothetical protein FE374_14335 [Georgenia yuyongxinii]|uniref:PucR family transcriptional regulator n=1 Tax=Georgenia yuyongxinii TaxID=2589797 RepID=A0A5B8C5Z2_9MICO|nr:helix-turn-helix domain-containing protein [Georgenia yuyongxinii]QDC25627.1 hypothetical protein FE374_14335 [Georgenia yuyongxinii]